MTDQVRHRQFVLKTQVGLGTLDQSESPGSGQNESQTQDVASLTLSRNWLTRYLSNLIVRFTESAGRIARQSFERTASIGGAQLIFRRENRGESFQRQIDNLRQQSDDSSPAEEEHEYERESYGSDEFEDTSRFSTDQGTPPEGVSFSATRADSEESVDGPAAPPAVTRYQDTSRWQPGGDSSTSVIAANSHWNGTLKSEGSLRIHGRADGELHSATDLFVAEGAEVDASLFAESVVVAGLVRGKIEARARLEVMPQGEVTGDVRSPKLVVHEGATISGQLKMEGFDSQSTYSQETNPSPTSES